MERNLPIKFFSKRNIDERKTEAGGSNEPPKWVLFGAELDVRADQLINSLQEQTAIFDERRKRNREFIPAVLKVEVNESAIAKSYRSDIDALFSDGEDNMNLIGYTFENELLVKVDTENALNKIIKRLSTNQRKRYDYGISAITEVKIFTPAVIERDPVGKPLEIELINFQNYNLNKAIEALFEATCKEANIVCRRLKYSSELITYKVTNVSMANVDTLKDFEGIREIEFMPQYRISFDDFSINETEDVPIKAPIAGRTYPTVGVLDSGISDIDSLRPWILPDRFTVYPESRLDRTHGTFVAGIILYGDELEGQPYTGLDGCYLYDAAIIPSARETIDQDELIDNIRRAIESRPDIRIWNLSVGTREECDTHKFSSIGVALDELQKQYNIVISKSAGNCNNFLKNPPVPVARIAVSADSIRSLVVGSIAHRKNRFDLADVDNPSPFSRVGKGPSYVNKPELVHYGGNAGKDSTGKLAATGVNSFTLTNGIATNIGTSFSTPRVTAVLAGIEHNIAESFDPLLVKALSIHNAKYPLGLVLPPSEKLRQVGFGVPNSINNTIYNSADEITLILQDNLEKGQFIEVTDFPFPQSMVADGYYFGEIIVTVVSSPTLDPNNGLEYCQSNLEVKLGTYDDTKVKDLKKRTVRNEIGLDGTQNLLNTGGYATRYKKSNIGDFSTERILISYGDKYQAIKKYAVNLEELTPAYQEKFLKAPKKWYLRVTGFYRDFIVKQAKINGELLSQEFCILITIRNRRGREIYSEVTQLLDLHNFVHGNIKIREQVRIQN
jgi:hypothetical protein